MEIINTKRLILRPFEYKDLDDVHQYASNPDVVKYMLFGPNSLEDTRSFIDKIIYQYRDELPIRHLEYAIEYNNKLIGGISLHLEKNMQIGEIGWILNPIFHRQGIMSEAAIAFVDYALNVINAKKIIAHCDERNIASFRLMEKLGMKNVGINKGVRVNKKNSLYEFDELVYELNNLNI